MAKKITKTVKMQVPAGKATPAPPLGPALGQAGVNISAFVNEFNDRTKQDIGHKVSVVLRVFEDRSFEFDVKTPITKSLILKAAGLEKGSGKNRTSKAGSLTKAQVQEIAETKMKDLNAKDLAGAMKIVEGQCKSMGIEVK
ncbi:MAG: 50S ribosomal protein L11 [Candidatus Paceibacterota bacterium]